MLAGIVALLDATSIRIGNEEYVEQNGSFGLTTLRDRHVTIDRSKVELRFVGKGGLRKHVVIKDRRLLNLIKQARAVPGARLFQYHVEGEKPKAVTAADVNEYLSEIAGQPCSAKDFRTWKASSLAAGLLYDARDVEGVSKRRRVIKNTICEAAESLGNTPTICRNYYIHPGLFASYEESSFGEYFTRFRPRRCGRLCKEEQILMRFLKRWEPTAQL